MIKQKQLRIEDVYFVDSMGISFFCADEVWNYFNKPARYKSRRYFLVVSDEKVDGAVKIVPTTHPVRRVERRGPWLISTVCDWLYDVGFADDKPAWMWMEYE